MSCVRWCAHPEPTLAWFNLEAFVAQLPKQVCSEHFGTQHS